jgi:hypothetical protein
MKLVDREVMRAEVAALKKDLNNPKRMAQLKKVGILRGDDPVGQLEKRLQALETSDYFQADGSPNFAKLFDE